MTIKARIDEARGLCRDIESDLAQVEALRGAGKPEQSEEYLSNTLYVLLNELREHVNELLEHYERQRKKKEAPF